MIFSPDYFPSCSSLQIHAIVSLEAFFTHVLGVGIALILRWFYKHDFHCGALYVLANKMVTRIASSCDLSWYCELGRFLQHCFNAQLLGSQSSFPESKWSSQTAVQHIPKKCNILGFGWGGGDVLLSTRFPQYKASHHKNTEATMLNLVSLSPAKSLFQ